jgi:hypothetical protein
MRKLLVNPWVLLAILCLAIEGDLPGITGKIAYIQSVGCNAIWINPIFESPFGDAGYDVADFYKVAPRYGTNEDLKNLCAEAHKRGMHVCLDLVAGHTSIAHPWFQQSALDQPNPFSNWYIWTPAGESVPHSQPSVCLPSYGRFRANHGVHPSCCAVLLGHVERGRQCYSITRPRRRTPERPLANGPRLVRHLRSPHQNRQIAQAQTLMRFPRNRAASEVVAMQVNLERIDAAN